jgi:hypothetical protein
VPHAGDAAAPLSEDAANPQDAGPAPLPPAGAAYEEALRAFADAVGALSAAESANAARVLAAQVG